MKKGYLYIAITTILFSTMEIVLKLLGNINPIQMTFTRFIVGGLVLLPFALKHLKLRGLRFTASDMRMFAISGFIGITLSMSLYQTALIYTDASVVAILFSSNPVFVLLFAHLLLRDPIYKRNILALALDIVGILFIINIINMRLDPRGVTLSILSALLFALYGVLGKKPSVKFGGLAASCMGFLFGGTEMVILSLFSHIPALASFLNGAGFGRFANIPFFQGYSLSQLPFLIYICVGVTGIGYACYFMAMESVPVSMVSLVFFFKPILAPILALFILGDPMPLSKVIGIIFILTGSLCNILPQILKDRRAAQKLEREEKC